MEKYKDKNGNIYQKGDLFTITDKYSNNYYSYTTVSSVTLTEENIKQLLEANVLVKVTNNDVKKSNKDFIKYNKDDSFSHEIGHCACRSEKQDSCSQKQKNCERDKEHSVFNVKSIINEYKNYPERFFSKFSIDIDDDKHNKVLFKFYEQMKNLYGICNSSLNILQTIYPREFNSVLLKYYRNSMSSKLNNTIKYVLDINNGEVYLEPTKKCFEDNNIKDFLAFDSMNDLAEFVATMNIYFNF